MGSNAKKIINDSGEIGFDSNKEQFIFKEIKSKENVQEILKGILIGSEKLNWSNVSQRVKSKLNDLDDPIHIMVVGEGKYGKSTFINTILRREIAPVSIIPKTWKIDLYFTVDEDKKEKAILVFDDLKSETVTLNEAKKFNQEEEQKIKNNPNYHSPLSEIRWYVSCPEYGERYCLIDTPGLGQLRGNTKMAEVRGLYENQGIEFEKQEPFLEYYHKADIAIWCLKADKLNAIQSYEKLQETDSFKKPIIGVITHIDKAPKENWKKIIRDAEKYYGNWIKNFLPSAAGADKSLKEETFRVIRSKIKDLTADKGVKEKLLKKDCEIEQNRFLNRSRELALFYSRNFGSYQKIEKEILRIRKESYDAFYSNLNAVLEKHSKKLGDSIVPTWSMIERMEGNKSQHFRSIFEPKLNDNTLLFIEIEDEIQAQLKDMEVELRMILKSHRWDALLLGNDNNSHSAIPLKVNFSFSGFIDGLRRKNESGISGGEGSKRWLIGGLAIGIGMILLGPIGILAGLVGMIFGNEKDECIEKAKTSINEKKSKILQHTHEVVNKEYEQITSGVLEKIKDSFRELTGGVGIEEILDKLIEIDTYVGEAEINPIDKELIIPSKLPKLKYLFFSKRLCLQSESWINKYDGEILHYREGIMSKFKNQVEKRLISEMEKGTKINEYHMKTIEKETLDEEAHYFYQNIFPRSKNFEPYILSSQEIVSASIEGLSKNLEKSLDLFLTRYKMEFINLLNQKGLRILDANIAPQWINVTVKNIPYLKEKEITSELTKLFLLKFNNLKSLVIINTLNDKITDLSNLKKFFQQQLTLANNNTENGVRRITVSCQGMYKIPDHEYFEGDLKKELKWMNEAYIIPFFERWIEWEYKQPGFKIFCQY